MDTRPSHAEARTSPAQPGSAQTRLDIRSMEISAVMKRRETTDEELELIDMRYRQALAVMSLEDLFAEGQLDCW